MSLIPFKYFTGVRTFTTVNSTVPSVAPFTTSSQAERTDTDVYLRSIWMATFRYSSTGSATPLDWWATSYVRLVITWDPQNLGDAFDVSDENPLTLGFVDLIPRYYAIPGGTGYVLVWSMPDGPLILQTQRDGLGESVKPAVLASLFYGDQNGFLSGGAESSRKERLQITGRVLWGSTSS